MGLRAVQIDACHQRILQMERLSIRPPQYSNWVIRYPMVLDILSEINLG